MRAAERPGILAVIAYPAMKQCNRKIAFVNSGRWLFCGLLWFVGFYATFILLDMLYRNNSSELWRWVHIEACVIVAALLGGLVSPVKPCSRFVIGAIAIPTCLFILTLVMCDDECRQLVR